MLPNATPIPYSSFTGETRDERLRKAVIWNSVNCPGRCWTLEQIAQVAGVTRERIRQHEQKALKRIRKFHIKGFDGIGSFKL
jgi:DNA-directed RNA polymerase sigma subunit (sigma70/sigma32)